MSFQVLGVLDRERLEFCRQAGPTLAAVGGWLAFCLGHGRTVWQVIMHRPPSQPSLALEKQHNNNINTEWVREHKPASLHPMVLQPSSFMVFLALSRVPPLRAGNRA